jgi:glutamine amidotransferase
LIDTLKEAAKRKPFLGICLGYQLMFDKSYEDGEFEGLGLLSGEVKKFTNLSLKIPHMGWNKIKDKYYYFVHSYYVDTDEDAEILYCDYGIKFAAGVKKENIWGFQFHPEKSQENGIFLLEQFLKKL